MKKQCKRITILLSAAFLVFFCSAALLFAAEPISIGFTADFSGSNAASGMQASPVVELVVKQINASGGINGRPINLVALDNGSDSAKATGNLILFKDKYRCKAVIANSTSGVAMVLKAWAEKNHIPVIAVNPQSDKLWVKSGKAWFFRVETPASPRVDAVLAKVKKLGYTKIAFEGSTLAWGTDTLATLKEKAPAYGMKLVSEVLVEPKTKDLTIQAKKLKDSGAQAVICAEYDAETVGLARAMKNIGWNPYVIHTSAANLMNALALADPAMMAGWETIQQIDPHKPQVQNTWSKTKEYTGKAPLENEEGPRAMDGINLLVSALKLSGNSDNSTAIRDAFYKIKDYERVLGKAGGKGGFTEGKNHLLDVQDLVIYTVKGGKLLPAK
ncbi:ABC transporter substrate-binding protein [Geobacter argillaceus]|uniref:ABC-type branched-subunit amino acid transport system substrate-binding protein n=1 Tax=Geobacter argillaceus TaxID=345631 RepID=A0A562V895_9BACT|nr:ABC transporter substrate-binding protein [Geobacter argillaceus]TWJ14008.1 ABC-type branched-subunit amino acid transport system substrate-binding protein [Geobacter argillaceus]